MYRMKSISRNGVAWRNLGMASKAGKRITGNNGGSMRINQHQQRSMAKCSGISISLSASKAISVMKAMAKIMA